MIVVDMGIRSGSIVRKSPYSFVIPGALSMMAVSWIILIRSSERWKEILVKAQLLPFLRSATVVFSSCQLRGPQVNCLREGRCGIHLSLKRLTLFPLWITHLVASKIPFQAF